MLKKKNCLTNTDILYILLLFVIYLKINIFLFIILNFEQTYLYFFF